ncbi:MAG: alpha/beta hydrolase [Sphaerochaetaceae bacterium]|nr:alpha/beta hydrolase [Sphaerochaetaceae bacterium]NLV84783.1 alpha/beta hydrolase [Spirochaetales bacterium]
MILYLFSIYITRKEKRSARSWYAEQLLMFRIKKGIFTYSDNPEIFLARQAIENEKRYELPVALRLIGKIQRIDFAGLDCFVLGGGSTSLRILYLHGGAYVEQPMLPHWTFLDALGRKTGAEIIVPIYPKAPVHTYQQTFTLLTELYRLLLDICRPCDTVFMGDSAGGGLALAFSQYCKEASLPQPKELVLLSPWLDVSMENPKILPLQPKDPMLQRDHLAAMGKAWAGSTDVHDWHVSPLYGDLTGLPPITMFVGTHEIFLADAYTFQHRAQQQHVRIDMRVYPKMNHVFPLFPIPEAKRAMREIAEIVERPALMPVSR